MTQAERPFRIVVAVDFSEASAEVAHWTARWMEKDWELILAHALVLPEVDSLFSERFPVNPSMLENARIGAERRLKDLSASIGHPRTWVEIREGRPADAVQQVAAEFSAVMIVVGSHGEGGRARGYPGRTADNLVRSARVPVLMVNRTSEAKPSRIVVALAMSSVTSHVVEWAAMFAGRFGAHVHGVHVVGSGVLSHVLAVSPAVTESSSDPLFTEERDRWGEMLAAGGIPSDGYSAEVVFGEVAEGILGAARDHHAGMIVIGSHAGRVRRLLLGSAAMTVMRNADVPVLVVPEPEARAGD